jgi:hypothetical protein
MSFICPSYYSSISTWPVCTDTSRTLFLLASTQLEVPLTRIIQWLYYALDSAERGRSIIRVKVPLADWWWITWYMYVLSHPPSYICKQVCVRLCAYISLFLPECACTTIIDISPRIFSLMYCWCVSIIIVICICPPGALIWLLNLYFYFYAQCGWYVLIHPAMIYVSYKYDEK